MSRWTIESLGALTEQQVFDMCAYHMLAHAGTPRDLLLKHGSQSFNEHRSWDYFVKQGRAPKNAAKLISSIEEIHRDIEPKYWRKALNQIAHTFKLEPIQ